MLLSFLLPLQIDDHSRNLLEDYDAIYDWLCRV